MNTKGYLSAANDLVEAWKMQVKSLICSDPYEWPITTKIYDYLDKYLRIFEDMDSVENRYDIDLSDKAENKYEEMLTDFKEASEHFDEFIRSCEFFGVEFERYVRTR